MSKINAASWDFVVLQEQSQIPSFPPSQVASDCFPYASILVDSIKSANPCAEPVFFMTWGRENGDQNNCINYPPLCTYGGMQARLRESYIKWETVLSKESFCEKILRTVEEKIFDIPRNYNQDFTTHHFERVKTAEHKRKLQETQQRINIQRERKRRRLMGTQWYQNNENNQNI